MRKREPSFLDTKKRTNPLLVIAIIGAIIVTFGIISYAMNYNAYEEKRHKTIEDVLYAVDHPEGSLEETTTEGETTTGSQTEETSSQE